MITIKNTQRKIAVSVDTIRQEVQHILNLLDYADFDLGIWLTTNKTIRAYNKRYREKDKPTDILSFAYHPQLQAGERVRVHDQEDKNLGDLIISLEYTQQEAHKLSILLAEHLRTLIIHGICHLLGYDHITDRDYKRMRAKEAWLLKKLHQRAT